MTVSINGTTGLVFNDASTQNTAASGFGFKNRIINGAMVVAQRGTAAVTTSGSFPVDRFFATASSLTFSAQQSSVAPASFIDSILWTQTSAATITSTSQFRLAHHIEGFNIADFGWGTANAQPVTLSFWVRSSVTGSYGIGLMNNANDRSYVASYTITAANTWEYKTITIAGDTTGTWLTDNGTGIKIRIDLGSGSNFQGTAGAWQAGEKQTFSGAASVATTSGATFYITGVQLEKGSTATSFDYRPYGTELALCQRYFCKYLTGTANYEGTGFSGIGYSSTRAYFLGAYPVEMRATPTFSYLNLRIDTLSNGYTVTGIANDSSSNKCLFMSADSSGGGLTQYRPYVLIANATTNAYLFLSAEL